MPLTAKNIEDWEKFCECPGLQTLLDFAQNEKLKVGKPFPAMGWQISTFESLSWRPSELMYESSNPNRLSLHSTVFVHASVHYLLYRAFPKIRGFPLLALLSECLAAAIDVQMLKYFYQTKGNKHPFVEAYVKARCAFYQKRPRDFFQILDSYHSPYEIYRQTVRESFRYARELFEWTMNPVSTAQSRRKVRAMSHGFETDLLFLHLNFPGFLLYAQNVCGRRTSASDIKIVEQVLDLLADCNGLDKFFDQLRAVK